MHDGSPENLSRNQSREVWTALYQIGQQLQKLASAAMGEGTVVPQSPAPLPLAQDTLTVVELVNQFLLAKARAGRSDRYLRALRNSLAKFTHGRAHTAAAAVECHEIEKWLASADWAPRTQRGYLGDVRTMYAFAIRRGLVRHNPAAGVEPPVVSQAPPKIHSPDQVRRVMEFARRYDANLCRCLAVRYFAGLRSAEADRLREPEIKKEFIEVTAQNAKTRKRRLVTIQPCLASWLALGGSLDFGDRGNRWRAFTASLKRSEGIEWDHNVTRHSFVSYHLSEFQNAGKTALEAGHTEAMLFAHYREVVTPEAAREFWAIKPRRVTAHPRAGGRIPVSWSRRKSRRWL